MTGRTHSAAEPLGVGDAIGHYRIIGVVGGGSLGRLYVAEQQGIRGVSKTVALRCIDPEIARREHFRELFLDAADVAPRFEHPNVVTVHEMGEVDGNYFVSMEYLPAENVASILTKCNTGAHVPPDIAASLVKQTATAVQYLHDVHAAAARPVGLGPAEVDPSNLFVTYHGTVKLLDVGFRSSRTANGSFSSPADRAASSRRAISHKARIADVADCHQDVFNLGVVLWTCLTGKKPELALGSGEAAAAAPSGRIVAPSSVRADVPEALDAIALRALSPDPLERFDNAHALSEALEHYLVRRESWPTPRHVRRWLEQLFDSERASLHMQIAEGHDVESALALLQHPSGSANVAHTRTGVRPRELWSTSHAVFSRLTRGSVAPPRSYETTLGSAPHERFPVSSIVPRSTPTPVSSALSLPAAELPKAITRRPPAEPRRWMVVAVLAGGLVIALGTAALLSWLDSSSPLAEASRDSLASDTSGRIDVRSTPEGAAVFVDGEPTGLRTPAVLKGLERGRSIQIRVEKAGFASQERAIEIASGSVATHTFELVASAGVVHFTGMPADARIYVDNAEVAVNPQEPVSLSVGPHSVRVETPDALVFSGTVLVVAGEQSIRVDGAATP